MAHTVGIIANPRAGKDIRRLVGHAAAPSDTSRIADIRRLIVGAIEGGAERILVAKDAQGLSARAVGGCLLYTSPSPRDATLSRMPSSA